MRHFYDWQYVLFYVYYLKYEIKYKTMINNCFQIPILSKNQLIIVSNNYVFQKKKQIIVKKMYSLFLSEFSS